MADATKDVISRFYAAVSGRDKPRELLARYATDESLVAHILAFEAAFPCYEISADEMIAEGERVAVRATIRGIHGGEFLGVARTGRSVSFSAVVLYTVRDAKIVDHWLKPDRAGLLEQLGATLLSPGA